MLRGHRIEPVEIAHVLDADSVAVGALDPSRNRIDRSAHGYGAIWKRRQVLCDLGEASLQMRSLHSPKKIKVIGLMKVLVRRNESVVTLHEFDNATERRSVNPRGKFWNITQNEFSLLLSHGSDTWLGRLPIVLLRKSVNLAMDQLLLRHFTR
jgi:hypothetical protein